MKVAGVKELKNRLSEYLRDVKRGETILVTDRGAIVARLAPAEERKSDAGRPEDTWLQRMIDEGRITPAEDPSAPFPEPVPLDKPLSDEAFDALMDELREDKL